MPSNLPSSTQKLRPADQDLSIIQDNLAIPLDKLLAFATGLISGTTAEIISVAAITVAGAIAAATLAVTGTITAATLAVTGTITAASVSSAAGFKAVIGPFNYFNSTYPGGATVVVTSTALKDNSAGALQQVQVYCTMPFAGSVVGVGAAYYGSTNTTTQVTVLKNNATLVASSTVVPAGTAFTYGKASYAKGTYAFAAGDRLSVSVSFGAAGSCGAEVFLFVELAA